MAYSVNIPEDLYITAMSLFADSGYAVTDNPIFINHTPERVVYFDSSVDASLSRSQRNILKEIANISHLFDVTSESFDEESPNTCGVYSIELLTIRSSRSQVAYDAHIALRPFLSGNANIILFRHDGKLMLTMQGFDSDVVLSDWFDEENEIDQLIERLDIGNTGFHSAQEYISDVIYNCARWYYIHPVSGEQATYASMPLNSFSASFYDEQSYTRDDLKDIARETLFSAEREYGNDYVESDSSHISSTIDISAELDLLSLDIDLDDDEESLFDDDVGDAYDGDDFDDEYDDDYNDSTNQEKAKDVYEFDEFDEELFRDPLQMLKFLESNDKRENDSGLPEPLAKSASESSTGVDLATFFREFDLEVIDKRDKGGCLWVIGEEETLKEYIDFAEEEYGVTGNFASSKTTNGRPGWYTRSNR